MPAGAEEMDPGTMHVLNVMHLRPAEDVAEEWLRTVARVQDMAVEGRRLASREDALQQLALEHFGKRYEYDPGVTATDAERVHELLAASLERVSKHDAATLLDCMAGWYLTADARYRTAVRDALHR